MRVPLPPVLITFFARLYLYECKLNSLGDLYQIETTLSRALEWFYNTVTISSRRVIYTDFELCSKVFAAITNEVGSHLRSHAKYTQVRRTLEFLTIQKLGDGYVYSACDGIPRFRFSSTPTAETTKIVTQVVSELTYAPISDDSVNNKIDKLVSARPNDCWRLDNLSWELSMIRGNPTSEPTDCYVWPLRHEVVLLYWPPRNLQRDTCFGNLGERTKAEY